MKKLIVILFLFASHSYAQTSLRLTQGKKITYDYYYASWQTWPDEFSPFQAGYEPVMQISNLDDQGYDFTVRLSAYGQQYSFEVTYRNYDSRNNWYAYEDAIGDQVCIVGSTMSELAQHGWPSDNRVQIYFWVYSQSFALELE